MVVEITELLSGYFVLSLYLYHMKYLITESQFDKVIFKYLDNQDFIRIEKDNKIYFVNSEGDEYAQIRYDEDSGWCYINKKLVEEISTFFSIQEFNSQLVIGRWVENTIQMEVKNTERLRYLLRPKN
jgi:hypothetical protein